MPEPYIELVRREVSGQKRDFLKLPCKVTGGVFDNYLVKVETPWNEKMRSFWIYTSRDVEIDQTIISVEPY